VTISLSGRLGRRILALACGLAMTATLGAAAPPRVRVTQVWSRPALAGDLAVVYATLAAAAGPGDRLVGIESPIATSAELHETAAVHPATARAKAAGGGDSMPGMPMQGMSMERVASLAIPGGGRALLAPGGYHVMLIGLRRGLRAGDAFPVTFVFACAGRIATRSTVRLS